MQMRSHVGRGSVFKVSVELAAGAAEVEPSIEASPSHQPPLFILVIDDEIAIQEAMAALLSGWGHHVVTAGSCAEMHDHASDFTSTPDLIISDYRLRDDEEGITTIERLRSEFNSDIPAILMTGDTAPDRIRQATASDCFLLHKPVSNGRLRAAIVNLTMAAKKS
ncbi:MAG: response regulator [Bradyrhizobium sp.]